MIVINPSGRTWTDGRTGQTGPIGICIKFKTGGVTLDLHQTHSPNNCSGLWTTARARPTLTSSWTVVVAIDPS